MTCEVPEIVRLAGNDGVAARVRDDGHMRIDDVVGNDDRRSIPLSTRVLQKVARDRPSHRRAGGLD